MLTYSGIVIWDKETHSIRYRYDCYITEDIDIGRTMEISAIERPNNDDNDRHDSNDSDKGHNDNNDDHNVNNSDDYVYINNKW